MKFVAPLNDVEIQTLTDMHRFHPSRRARMRAHSILLSHQGCSLRRIADIYQVSRYAVFLVSEGAGGVTGQPVVIDGGYTAQ